ncbi:MAG: adenylate/guanylate cyclase domain-containing protein [Prochlorothrix sp.]
MLSPLPDRRTAGKVPLHTALVLPFILQLVGTACVVGWLVQRNGENSLRQLATQLRTEVIEHVHDRLSDYVAAPHLVNENNQIALNLGMLSWDNLAQAETYFHQQALAQPSIGYVGFANEKSQYLRVGWVNRLSEQPYLETAIQTQPGGGTLTFYSINPKTGQREEISKTIPDYDVRSRPFYTIVHESSSAVWIEIYGNIAYPVLQINASLPYYDQNGNLDGILTCQLALNQISAFLQFIQEDKPGEIYIMERSGYLVASSLETVPLLIPANPETDPAPAPAPTTAAPKLPEPQRVKASDSNSPLMQASSRFLEQEFGQLSKIGGEQQLDFYSEGKRNFIQVSPFQDPYGLDWLIVAVAPEADFMAEVQANQQRTLLLCGLTLFAVTTTSFFITRRLTQPLQTLIQSENPIAPTSPNSTPNPTANPITAINSTLPSFIQEFDRLHQNLTHLTHTNQHLQADLLALEQDLQQRLATLEQEKTRSEQVLLNLLPPKLTKRLQKSKGSPAQYIKEVSLLFADLVSFTALENEVAPLQLVQDLNTILATFDTLTDHYGLEKVKTIGNAYLVIGGLSNPALDHAAAIADLALAIQSYVVNHPLARDRGFQVRIGINTGPLIAGTLGQKNFIYDLWSDTVMVAAQVESRGNVGYIQVTQATYDRLKDQYDLEPRSPLHLKAQSPLKTYWLRSKRSTP